MYQEGLGLMTLESLDGLFLVPGISGASASAPIRIFQRLMNAHFPVISNEMKVLP